ncbi:hypothetical protein ACFSQ3_08790 [Sphingobacterium corticis]|uniref:Uncharacterized protein n=1 Tax=Sphingobacterium corticis TaxID=1812823 RepID=A0ABW5NM69_9SPHI
MKNTFVVKTSLFTLILALIAIGTFAFNAVMNKNGAKVKKPEFGNQTWHYTGGSNPADFNKPQNWELGTSPVTCDAIQEVPCQLSNVTATDRDELQTLLADYPEQAIFEIAVGRSAP